ncbi:hypothetical protein FRUB_00635 [Fimbriiglobus ruber]|uniref:Uncharacterized protein n=1 Tax=Fimbriiglobus ruber TaxID=1908690 RepID=A0A225EA75_9BACT|nr:hypothetical protein FRUB_00635 [Fimbriiglobus ruber]
MGDVAGMKTNSAAGVSLDTPAAEWDRNEFLQTLSGYS